MGCGNPLKKIEKEFKRAAGDFAAEANRFLDRRVGIDDEGLRTATIIAGSAIIGAGIGAAVAPGMAVGAAAASGSATAGSGIVMAGVIAGGALAGATVGTIGAKELMHSQQWQPLDPLKPFSLPTNFELTSARSELQSVLRKKRARSRTDFTGGRLPSAQVTAPRLKTV